MKAIEIWGREWEEKSREAAFAVLPLSSFEYHGPMAPMGTDAAIADYFAKQLALRSDCIVYPPVYYTACPNKTVQKPTVSVAPDVMVQYIMTLLNAIYQSGFNRVMILNSHDGNMGVARAAAEQVVGKNYTLIVNWWELLAPSETKMFFTDGGRGHGGPYELSCAWAALGQRAKGEKQYDRPAYKLTGNHVHIESAPRQFKGYAGLISQATSETGEKILRLAYKKLEKTIEVWKEYTKEEGKNE